MKILYFDVETTGLDPIEHSITQLAGVIEVDGNIVEEFNFDVCPLKFDNISDQALKITGKTISDLKSYPTYNTVYKQFTQLLDKHLNKYDKNDKYLVCGYNVAFDLDFLRNFFISNYDNYFFSYFSYKRLDPLQILFFMEYGGLISLPDYKLSTVCSHLDIKIDAHDALSDIKATRELLIRIAKSLFE